MKNLRLESWAKFFCCLLYMLGLCHLIQSKISMVWNHYFAVLSLFLAPGVALTPWRPPWPPVFYSFEKIIHRNFSNSLVKVILYACDHYFAIFAWCTTGHHILVLDFAQLHDENVLDSPLAWKHDLQLLVSSRLHCNSSVYCRGTVHVYEQE